MKRKKWLNSILEFEFIKYELIVNVAECIVSTEKIHLEGKKQFVRENVYV